MKRKDVIRKKIQEFSNAKLVITDRLHGMIYSAISSTPCIVLGNNHHKIKDSYEWISYLPYIKYANNIDEAVKLISELLELKDCKYDNTQLIEYYNRLVEVIKEQND